MTFNSIFKVKKEVSEEQFLRGVLIGLSNDEKSPSNIMNAKFGKVSEFQKEFLVLFADVTVNYSGTIGYNREETYYETEKYYDSDLKMQRTRQVEKTRTVTDWHPYNGSLNTNKETYEVNEDDSDYELGGLFYEAIKQAKDENVIEEGEAIVNPSSYKAALLSCESQAKDEVKWPGDEQKDARFSCKTDVKDLECYLVPCYEVSFEYNGKKYIARGLAIGNVNEIHEVPQTDGYVESEEMIENRRKQNVANAEKLLKVKSLCVVVSVLMGIVGLYGLIAHNIQNAGAEVCLPLGFITMAVGIICAIAIKSKVNKNVDEINLKASEEKAKLKNIKKLNLQKALEELNLPPLDNSEK